MLKIGFGFDTHALQSGKFIKLGGIEIPSDKSSIGHSDADVLLHAICDALLGAAGLPDIGTRFPDQDVQYKGIDSRLLLNDVVNEIYKQGYSIQNIDSTICLEKPKISPYMEQIKQSLAEIMHLQIEMISVKAKTSEKLGFIGRQEGISAYAVVLLAK